MSAHPPNAPRAIDADDQLTSLLARWVQRHALQPAKAAVIRESILSESPEAQHDWWWHLLEPVWATAQFADSDWSAPWVAPGQEYRPYLRLA